jgi:hypothetical protein
MGQSRLEGSIQAGPPNVTDGTFPASTATFPLAFSPNPKSYNCAEPTLARRISSIAFVPLSGVGPNDTVTEAGLVYLRSDSPLEVRITQVIDGSPETSIHKIHGLLLLEPPGNEPVTLVEVLGNATIDFYVQGQR